jgi:hypothetical protein
MSATKRFKFAILAPPLPPSPNEKVGTLDWERLKPAEQAPNPYQGDGAQRAIIRHLIGNNVHGPLSVFDICLRAAQLRGRANEEHVAACVQSVLINYNWLEEEIDKEIAQRDIEQATGVPMRIRR